MKDIHIIIIFLAVILILISVFILIICDLFGLYVYPLPPGYACQAVASNSPCSDFTCDVDYCMVRYIEIGSPCDCTVFAGYDTGVYERNEVIPKDDFYCGQLWRCIGKFYPTGSPPQCANYPQNNPVSYCGDGWCHLYAPETNVVWEGRTTTDIAGAISSVVNKIDIIYHQEPGSPFITRYDPDGTQNLGEFSNGHCYRFKMFSETDWYASYCTDECTVEGAKNCCHNFGWDAEACIDGDYSQIVQCQNVGGCLKWQFISRCPSSNKYCKRIDTYNTGCSRCHPEYTSPWDERFCPSVAGSYCPNLPDGSSRIRLVYMGDTMSIENAIATYSTDCALNRYSQIVYQEDTDIYRDWVYGRASNSLTTLENGKCYNLLLSIGGFCHWSLCTEGWLDEYKCSGDYRQRKYQFSDCSTEWLTIEDCNSHNEYTSCSWSCYDSDTRRCTRDYYDYYCSGGGASCVAQAQDASYNEDCPSGQVCANGICGGPEGTLIITWIDVILQALGFR